MDSWDAKTLSSLGDALIVLRESDYASLDLAELAAAVGSIVANTQYQRRFATPPPYTNSTRFADVSIASSFLPVPKYRTKYYFLPAASAGTSSSDLGS